MGFDETYQNHEDEMFGYLNDHHLLEDSTVGVDPFAFFDDSLEDIDFSEIEGKSFKKAFSKVNRQIAKKGAKKGVISKAIGKPLVSSMQHKNIEVNDGQRAIIRGAKKKKITKVLVPRDRKVIVEGVSKFILADDKASNSLRQIGYYKGEKLKELVLIFNNNSALPFTIEIFNPSSPLDYLYSTSQNLNNKIQVSGGVVQYTDVLFNLLGNPTMIPNCKFTFAGPLLSQQFAQVMEFKNKNIEGAEKIHPLNLSLQIDTMQVQNDIAFFDIQEQLNRPFIPNGMDVIRYTVLPGMTVNMAFFYKQVDMKKVFYPEARESREIM